MSALVQLQRDSAISITTVMRASVQHQISRQFESSEANVALERTLMNSNVVHQLRFTSELAPTLVATESLHLLLIIFDGHFLRLRFLVALRKHILCRLSQHSCVPFRITFHYRRYHPNAPK